MKTLKILIATGNPGKFEELKSHFSDLPFEFVSLRDLSLHTIDLEEPYDTTWENALHKAKFFAQKSGLVTIAEDTAFYVEKLGGMPGVKAKRYGRDDAERMAKVLEGLKGVPLSERTAYFEVHGCIYNPTDDSFSVFKGRVDGLVPETIDGEIRAGMSYDSLFFYSPLQKTFANMSVAEKNNVSHRGKLARLIKIFLSRQYCSPQIICPVGLIIKDRRLFLNKRRDIHPAMNNKWEFPGGGVDNGESIEACVVREIKEETGFDVEIISPLSKTYTVVGNPGTTDQYQVFHIDHICRIIGGELKLAEEESAGHGWFTYEEALQQDLLDLNRQALLDHRDFLKQYLD
jgi:XTP/dITP diphosphohydrolase